MQYVARVEHSPHVMVVESMSLTADRAEVGVGRLQMTVSCLTPAPAQAEVTVEAEETL